VCLGASAGELKVGDFLIVVQLERTVCFAQTDQLSAATANTRRGCTVEFQLLRQRQLSA